MNMFKVTTAQTPEEYISKIESPRKEEIQKLHDFIKDTVPELKPFMISGMIGYGKYRYKSASGKEGDWCTISLASQKNYISVYICAIKDGKYVAEQHKKDLPKADIGKSCIRFKKIEDIDLSVLASIIKEGSKSPMGMVS